MRLFADRSTTWPLTAVLLTALLLRALPTSAAAPAEAQLMPKAAQSMLLDLARAGSRIVAVGERGHILVSNDQGRGWQQIAAPTRSLLTSVFFLDDRQGWCVGHDGVILGTQDGGTTWKKLRAEVRDDTTPPLMDVWFADAQRGWAVGAYGTFLGTQDGGNTWADIAGIIPNPDELHLNAIAGDRNGNLFIAGEQGTLLISHDQGATWKASDSGYAGSLFGVLISQDSKDVFAFGLRGTLLHSQDEGATWNTLGTATDTSLNGGFINNDETVLVGLEGTVRVRRAGQETFDVIDSGTRAGFSSAIPLDRARLLISGQGGTHIVSLDNKSAAQ